MLDNINIDLQNFISDINDNLENEADKSYVIERTTVLLDNIINKIENMSAEREEKLEAFIKKQKENEIKLQELEDKVSNIYEDIYEDEEEDFSITCPYCNYEFEADINEDLSEIKCPECGNSIELDWYGNLDDENDNGCSGHCSNCGGCE